MRRWVRAVGIGKGLVQHAAVALPGAVHHHGEAFDHLARAVGEHAVGVQRAVEVVAQIQHWFFIGILLDAGGGTASGQQADGSGGAE
jgi:hypothetical protein